jgi:hypothetical protein
MHRYGLVAAEDGNKLSEHVRQRMSSVSVAVRGDCVGLRAAPTRKNSQVSVSWQVG